VSALPDRFGKYHVLDRLAQGGMAEIYRVKTVGIAGFEKRLALKRILPAFAREPRFIRSFIDEARIAVSLNHRAIVQVFDFGRAGGELYLAMELIDGVDLHSAIRDAAARQVPLPVALACYILGDVATGLDYAHTKADAHGRSLGIVHCDVSPHNIMLSYEGFVKILDFGVSRASFSAAPKKRRLRGKPRYMAPEQTRGEPAASAADVFALATVAWELFTGLPLFEGQTVKDILAAVRRADAPPPHKLNPDVSEALSLAVARALSRDPGERGTAAELANAIAAARHALDPRTGARSLADWLRAVYPDLRDSEPGAAAGEPTPTPGADEDDTAAALPSLLARARARAGGSLALEWDEDEAITQVPGSLPEPPPQLVALVDKRRVVAVAALLEHEQADTRRELQRGLCELAYKHGAVLVPPPRAANTSAGAGSASDPNEDQVLVVFGFEIAGEDDVAHAMGYSLDAVELVRSSERGAGSATVRLAARAGIVAQRKKTGAGYQLVGDALEEARALARHAEPGRPLLAGGPGRLASAHYAFRELPARRPRGRRLQVLELLGPRTFDERDRALRERRGRFVGRERELEALTQAGRLALERRQRITVTLVGEAGVGKSRLCAEFVGRAGRPHALVAVAATPAGRDAPYSLLVQIFQAALNLPPGRGQEARGRLAQRMRYVLGQAGRTGDQIDNVLSAVEKAMELRDGVAGDPAAGAATDLRERVEAALHSFRQAVVTGDTLHISVLEDVHFIDGASAEVFMTALSRPAAGAELVILTCRQGASHPALPEPDQTVAIERLTEDHATLLIRDRLGDAANDDTVRAVVRRAGGNPLFIEELADAVRETGSPHIPKTAEDVILARVHRLPDAQKSALQHAAVAGPMFRARILEELLGPKVHLQLTRLSEAGLLTRADRASVDAPEGELAFTHGLLQEVVYQSLTERARRQTHARLGHLLASRYRAGREEPPAAIARHFEAGGEPQSAATYWLRAGNVALAAHDAVAARDAFSRTLALDANLDPDNGDEAARRSRRRDALGGRERAHSQLGDHQAQAHDLGELEALATRDPLRLANLKNRIADRALRLGDYAAAVTASHEAERYARHSGDEIGRGEALRVRAAAYERLCHFDRALEATNQALEIFLRTGAVDEETRALIGIGRTHIFAARYESALAAYGPALERVQSSGDPWLERIVRNNVAVIHLCLGDYSQAMASAERSLEICQRYGDRAREGDNLAVCGTIFLLIGQYRAAYDRLAAALAIHDQTGSRWSRADGLVYAGTAQVGLGDVTGGLAHLDESIRMAREIGAPYIEANAEVARAAALLVRGDPGDAEAASTCASAATAISRRAALVGTEIQGLSRQAAALLVRGDDAAALQSSAAAIALLDQQRFIEGAEEEILFVHAQLLAARSDPAADTYLRRAHDEVARKRDLLDRPEWRDAFTGSIRVNQAILAAWAARCPAASRAPAP
jgi:serine/threonine protein kinase/tetratricopeptide (TPR) repeat protein